MQLSEDQLTGTRWLIENGPKHLACLIGSIVFQSSTPVVIADDSRRCVEASMGASQLLGLSRGEIIGRSLDEFMKFDAASVMLLPDRHLLVLTALDAKTPGTKLDSSLDSSAKNSSTTFIPASVQDYALFLLDVNGDIVTWYAGAERMYGYESHQVSGRHVSLLDADQIEPKAIKIPAGTAPPAEAHFANEGLQVKKDGSQFWANVITMELRDESGALQGFARVDRDFSVRRKEDEKLLQNRAHLRVAIAEQASSSVVVGEFKRITEANNIFLDLIGYSRTDLVAGRLSLSDLTPPEYLISDDLAYEEALRTGTSTPFEKELICKDGSRVPVLVETTLLNLSPFRWITILRDLRDRTRWENQRKDESGADEITLDEILGTSEAMRRVTGQVSIVAPTDATVLVLGETGTGKELVARAIHKMSRRRDAPFISLNCAAIPTGLLESELFGYEKGAFTGALSQKIGRFEMANRGTLFLDEVGDIPLDLQPKLLRALQEKSYERLGGTKTIPIDVRLVAATNQNLEKMMKDKTFRSDLYYRLKVFPINTPPLRDRQDDIPILVRHFTTKYAEKLRRQIDKIPAHTMKALVKWSWPGNVRELENFIERSVIVSTGSILEAPVEELCDDRLQHLRSNSDGTLDDIEREYILRILKEKDGVISTAATHLGMPRTTLNALMKKLGISRNT